MKNQDTYQLDILVMWNYTLFFKIQIKTKLQINLVILQGRIFREDVMLL